MRTLEQMREAQQHWANRYQSQPVPVSDFTRAYAQRINQPRLGEGNAFADIMHRLQKRTGPVVQAQPCPLTYEEAKFMFWQTSQALAGRQSRPFVVDDDNRAVIRNLIGYLVGDTAHTELNLSQGLYLYGPNGTGKTLLLAIYRLLCEVIPLSRQQFRIVPAKQIALEVEQAKNSTALRPYLTGPICFDDLGEEPRTVRLYSNTVAIMETILSERTRQYVETGLITHATSNLLPEDLEAHYGTRIADRCRQLFNFVQVGTEDTPSRR